MKLDHFLRNSDWSEDKLGAEVGVAGSTISRIRTGARDASLALAIAIELVTDREVLVEDLPLSDFSRRWWLRWSEWAGV